MSHYVSSQYEVFMVFLFGVNLRQETDRQTDSQTDRQTVRVQHFIVLIQVNFGH